MSGGVDSSVAACLLKKQGYRVSGVTMQIWQGEAAFEEGKHHACYGPGEGEDIEDARKVCQILDIPFHIIDLRQEYKTEVLDYYCNEYLSGRTPNPCFRCNSTVKFGALLRKTRESARLSGHGGQGIEFDFFATGHYARVEYNKEKKRYLLKKAADLSKDQSYFISSLSQEQLARALFPIGNFTKSEIRKMATDFGLPVDNKPESQDFIAGGYQSLIGATPTGPITDRQGNVLGEHRGIPFYTIGQRKGLGISSEEPQYVIEIDSESNTIVVGNREQLYNNELIASGLNWIAIEKLERPIEVAARIRYRHKEAEATVTPMDENKVFVKFNQPQPAITPGQTVVFYQGDVVVGAGTIERSKE